MLSGTPTTAGTDTITYEVTDDDGASESDTFDIDVSAAAIVGTGDVVRVGPLIVRADRDVGEISAAAGSTDLSASIELDEWVHVAVRRTASLLELWVDGVRQDSGAPPTGAVLDNEDISFAVADGTDDIDLALDEWGIWPDAIDAADLYARTRYRRRFGGNIVATSDLTSVGAADIHVFKLTASGLRLRAGARPRRNVRR